MLSKFLSIFTFSNATLLVALTLSSIAAWYSIIGLIAIFAGAFIPIIIMGSALELAKITTTVWLRKYWTRCAWIMKIYLVPAVVLLALLTSMGIFGFLSKAHMDQGVTSGDAQGKVAIYDEKIKTAKDNIDANRKALKQLDEAVDQVMGRSTDEKGADKAVAIRRSQANDRKRLLAEIQTEQTTISKLSEERAPLASELRKVEAEVGPIKYIAALIYGDNPDANLLERAVRWVIILLVAVFDPLALMLVIAANQSKQWDKEDNEATLEPAYEPDDGPINEEALEALREQAKEELPQGETIVKEELFPDEPINCYKCGTKLVNAPGIGLFCPNKECDVLDGPFEDVEPIKIDIILPTTETVATPEEEEAFAEIEKRSQPNVVEEPVVVEEPKVEPIVEEPKVETSPNFEGVKLDDGSWMQTGPEFVEKKTTEVAKTEAFKDLGDDYVEFEGKRMGKHVLQQIRPDLFSLKEDNPREVSIGFGSNPPESGMLGDNFIKTDVIPHQVFKYNGRKWIQINKVVTGAYLSNTNYLQHLMEKISTGEYDPELLTEYEQDAIANHIKSTE